MALPDTWQGRLAAPDIAVALATGGPHAPFGVNLVIHRSKARLRADLDVTVARRVPLVITWLGVDPDVVAAIHSYGGLVFHDVTNRRFAERALVAGVDGLIAVSHGAGAHAGQINPFALLAELRQILDGPLALGGAITGGAQGAAAQMAGADLAYIGTRFLATREADTQPGHLEMILRGGAWHRRDPGCANGCRPLRAYCRRISSGSWPGPTPRGGVSDRSGLTCHLAPLCVLSRSLCGRMASIRRGRCRPRCEPAQEKLTGSAAPPRVLTRNAAILTLP